MNTSNSLLVRPQLSPICCAYSPSIMFLAGCKASESCDVASFEAGVAEEGDAMVLLLAVRLFWRVSFPEGVFWSAFEKR